jgi:hypothetical protein
VVSPSFRRWTAPYRKCCKCPKCDCFKCNCFKCDCFKCNCDCLKCNCRRKETVEVSVGTKETSRVEEKAGNASYAFLATTEDLPPNKMLSRESEM